MSKTIKDQIKYHDHMVPKHKQYQRSKLREQEREEQYGEEYNEDGYVSRVHPS